MTHEHEAWMLDQTPEGEMYCRACGNRVVTPPRSTRFSSTLAEAAWAIANHGFTEAEYGISEGDGWNALLSLNAVTLLNMDETDLSERFRAEHGESTLLVWMRADRGGQVSVVKYAVENSADARAVEHDYYAAADGPESGEPDAPADYYRLGCGCDSGTH